MKPFGVAVLSQSGWYEKGYSTREEQRARPELMHIAYWDSAKAVDVNQHAEQEIEQNVRVWWCDTLGDAELLASKLAKKYAGKYYIPFESKMGFISQPGPVKKTIFNEKGMVPA